MRWPCIPSAPLDQDARRGPGGFPAHARDTHGCSQLQQPLCQALAVPVPENCAVSVVAAREDNALRPRGLSSEGLLRKINQYTNLTGLDAQWPYRRTKSQSRFVNLPDDPARSHPLTLDWKIKRRGFRQHPPFFGHGNCLVCSLTWLSPGIILGGL